MRTGHLQTGLMAERTRRLMDLCLGEDAPYVSRILNLRRDLMNLLAQAGSLILVTCTGLYLTRFLTMEMGTISYGYYQLAGTILSIAMIPVTAMTAQGIRRVTVQMGRGDYAGANTSYNSLYALRLGLGSVILLAITVLMGKILDLTGAAGPRRWGMFLLLTCLVYASLADIMTPVWRAGPLATGRPGLTALQRGLNAVIRILLITAVFRLHRGGSLIPAFLMKMTGRLPGVLAGGQRILVSGAGGVAIALQGAGNGSLLADRDSVRPAGPSGWGNGLAALGLVSLVMTLITLAGDRYLCRRTARPLHIFSDGRFLSEEEGKTIVRASFWASLSGFSVLALNGLDLLAARLFLGEQAMGILAIVRTVPTLLASVAGAITGAYLPDLTRAIGSQDRITLKRTMRRCIYVSFLVLNLILAQIFAMGDLMFRYLVPAEDDWLLYMLTVASIAGFVPMAGLQILYGVFTATGQVKEEARALAISALSSAILTLAGLFFWRSRQGNFDLNGLFGVLTGTIRDRIPSHAMMGDGLLIIVGISTLCNLVRNLKFTLPAAARALGLPVEDFYLVYGCSFLSVTLRTFIGATLRHLFPTWNLESLIIMSLILAASGLVIDIIWIRDAGSELLPEKGGY